MRLCYIIYIRNEKNMYLLAKNLQFTSLCKLSTLPQSFYKEMKIC